MYNKWTNKLLRLQNWLDTQRIHYTAKAANFAGVTTAYGDLSAKVIKPDGTVIDYGIICTRVITDAGVSFLCTDWFDGSKDITNFSALGCGTGTNAEAAGDTTLQTEVETRVVGTKSKPAANKVQIQGTQSMTGTRDITEQGVFDSTTVAGSTLWDRSVFAAINVVSGDSIQWTYTATVNSGG